MFPVVSTFGIIIISSFCVASFEIQIQTDVECNTFGGKVHKLPNSDAKYCCKEIKCPRDHKPKICSENDMNSTGCLPCPDKTWNDENWSTHMRECVPDDRFNPRPNQFFKKETAPNFKSTNTEKTSVLTKVSADMTEAYDHKQYSSSVLQTTNTEKTSVLTKVSADMTEAYDHKQYSSSVLQTVWIVVGVVVGVTVLLITLIVIVNCIKKRRNVNALPEKESRSSFSNFSASSDGYDSSSHHLLGSNKKHADLHQDAASTADSLSLNLQSTPVSNQDNVSSKDDRLNRPLNPSVMKQTERESTDLMLLSDPISNCSNSPVELLGNNSLEYVDSVVRQDINSHITSLSLPTRDLPDYDLDLREDNLPSPSASYTVVVDGDNHDARSGTAPHGEATSDTTIQIPDTSGNNLQIDCMTVNGPVNIYMQR